MRISHEGEGKPLSTRAHIERHCGSLSDKSSRRRILEAAFAIFAEQGYAGASTLEIARRARVSKRALYALIGEKEEILAACICEQVKRLQVSVKLPEVDSRDSLARALELFGVHVLREMTDPAVVAMLRLAGAHVVYSPELAKKVDSLMVEPFLTVLTALISQAKLARILGDQPADLADRFREFLLGDLMTRLLLRAVLPPTPLEIESRARQAAANFLELHAIQGN
jgi:AcrR family transcriptional regulator